MSQEINYEELVNNPKKFGAPTFEEFKRNRDKILGYSDEVLAEVENGTKVFRKLVKKHIYEIEGFRCKSLEEVERVAKSQGIPLHELDYRPEVIPLGGGKCEILVKFLSKNERLRRA